jgi:4-carboxymuconolactone decarboxylase
MPRLPDFSPDDLSPEARRVHDTILAGPRGHVIGPLRVWLTSPKLAERAQALGEFCRFNSSLAPHLSELAILVMAAAWKASFEWWAHAALARKAGVPDAVLEAIRAGQPPALSDDQSRAVYAFAHELLATKKVSDATYQQAVTALGTQSVVDLVGILGYYSLVSMTLNVFEVALPPGVEEPFA